MFRQLSQENINIAARNQKLLNIKDCIIKNTIKRRYIDDELHNRHESIVYKHESFKAFIKLNSKVN